MDKVDEDDNDEDDDDEGVETGIVQSAIEGAAEE